jgi:hypothetical protein
MFRMATNKSDERKYYENNGCDFHTINDMKITFSDS